MHPLGWQYETYPEVRKVLDQGAARPATVDDYAEWLEGHLWNRWGSVDFEFPKTDAKAAHQAFYFVTQDIDLPAFNGAMGLKIIAAPGVKVNFTGDIGDNEVYLMEDYSARMSKNHKLNIYGDALEALQPRGYWAEDFIYAKHGTAADFAKAVVRPAVARAIGDIEGGLKSGTAPMSLKLKPRP